MFRQIIAVTSINFRSIQNRVGMSLVIMLSVAAVVGVLLSMLALRAGVDDATRGVATASRAVLTSGTAGINAANVPLSQVPVIGDLPGVAHDAAGNPMIATYVSTFLDAARKGSGDTAYTQILGVNAYATQIYPQFHLTAGRMFRPALRELIVGKAAQTQYQGMKIGDNIHFKGVDWKIVGSYDFEGSEDNSNLYGDLATVMTETKQPMLDQVTVQLNSAADFSRFEHALTANPALRYDAKTEVAFLHDELESFDRILNGVGIFVAGIMALGAISAALNAMYAAVDQRKMEIATLRAIGFSGAAVAISVIAETLLVALPGAALGALIAYLSYNNQIAETDGVIYHLVITPDLVRLAFIWTAVISLAGGLPPAIRAARLPVVVALRAN